MRIVDQSTDNMFQVLIPLLEGRPHLTDMVKEAEVLPEELEKLADHAFAWPDRRLFPVHNKEHTIMSRLYREKCANVPQHVDDELKKACEIFEIPDSLFTREKKAFFDDPEDYLLPKQKRLKVKTAEDVSSAAELLVKEYTKLSMESRSEACARLIKKAEQHKVALPIPIMQLAGFTVSSTKMAQEWIEARKIATKDEKLQQAYEKLASVLDEFPKESKDRSALVKIADAIHTLDKKANLERLYDRKLLDPMRTVFNTEKVAANTLQIGNKSFSITRIASLPASFFGDVLGNEFIREASDGNGGVDVTKIAMIIDTLPTDMKQELANHLSRIGVR